MGSTPNQLEKALNSKVVEKAYDDAISPAAKELGKIGADTMKALRLIGAPLQVLAAFQDRFESFVERKLRHRVPDNRRIEPPMEVVGPAIEHMKFFNEQHPLWEMYEELLTRTVDIAEVANIHPAFVFLIRQLSRDEAILLYRLRESDFDVLDTLDLVHAENRFENRRIEKNGIPTDELGAPDRVEVSVEHITALSLVTWPVLKQDPIWNEQRVQTGVRRHSKIQLTSFGRLFTAACIPPQGFTSMK